MKCLVVLFITLGLAMSFPRPTPSRDARERDAVKDRVKDLADAVLHHPYRDPVKMLERDPQELDAVEMPLGIPLRDPQERDAVEIPPVLPHTRDPQERDPVELEHQMSGKYISLLLVTIFIGLLKVTFFLGSNMHALGLNPVSNSCWLICSFIFVIDEVLYLS